MHAHSWSGLTRALALVAGLSILVGCGGGSGDSLNGYNPGLPFGTDVADDTTDATLAPDVQPDAQPDAPPTACSADLDCDDGRPCTADNCGADGTCQHGVITGHCLIEGVCLDDGALQYGNGCKACRATVSPIAWSPLVGATCDDGDPCTVGDACVDGACVPGAPAPCDDGNPCTTDQCQPGTGCVHEGACACENDGDCKALDDDDKCNGRLRCDKSGDLPVCAIDPDTVVTCDTSHDSPCLKTTCLSATGACIQGTLQENGACDDADGCTLNDACHAGSCTGEPCELQGLECRDGACVEPDVNALTYGFDSDQGEFSGTDGWESQYCSDAWNTSDNGGVFPNTDDGCAVAENECTANYSCGWDWGYWVQMGYCQNSDPFDNHLTWGDKEWTDYSFSVRFKNDDDDTIGVVFRYTNSGQFYLLYFSRDQAPKEYFGCNMTYSGARLVRIADQTSTLLVKSDVTYQVGQVHRLKVDVTGPHLRVVFDQDADGDLADEQPLFDLDDWEPLLAGKVGLYAYENGATGDSFDPCSNGGCWFDDVSVVLK